MNATPHYDVELPFLAELEEHVRSFATRDPAAAAAPTAATPRRGATRRPRRQVATGRMIRRSAILVGLLCLVGATALGAHAVFFNGSPGSVSLRRTPLTTVARGYAGSDRWTMRLYSRGGQFCSELAIVGEQESSRCAAPPRHDAMTATSFTSPTRRYIYGVTGAGVRTVDVRVEGSRTSLATHALAARTARAIGAAGSPRYFIAVLGRPIGQTATAATLTARGATHGRIESRQRICVAEYEASCAE